MTNFLEDDHESAPEVRFDVKPKCANHCPCAIERLQQTPERLRREAAEIWATQAAFLKAVDGFIELYRGFDKTLRPLLKVKLRNFFEREFLSVGEAVGVSRISVDHIWVG